MTPATLDPFDFDLPESRIALRPARPRDSARLLVAEPSGALGDHHVHELPSLLSPGDLLVVNDTRVISAALTARRPARKSGGGGDITVTVNLLDRLDELTWRVFARPGKRLRQGDKLDFGHGLQGVVAAKDDTGRVDLAFNRSGDELDEAFEQRGAPPLPPYIARRRAVDDQDRDDYQTMFADEPGSVAAPTAGLHFTPRLLAALKAKGIETASVTLTVGAGTFAPVSDEEIQSGRLHSEFYTISEGAVGAIEATKARGGDVIAVGTTSLRALESAFDRKTGHVRAGRNQTQLFIQPGYQFGVVDRLMTNFHLPRSSLFMLVCALAGIDVARAAYAHAIETGYRFYSYGDACLFSVDGTQS